MYICISHLSEKTAWKQERLTLTHNIEHVYGSGGEAFLIANL